MCNVLIYDIPFGIRVFMHRDGVIREAKYRGMIVKEPGICGRNMYVEYIFWFGSKLGEGKIETSTSIYKTLEDAKREVNPIQHKILDIKSFSLRYLSCLIWDGIQFYGWLWDGSRPIKRSTRESLNACEIYREPNISRDLPKPLSNAGRQTNQELLCWMKKNLHIALIQLTSGIFKRCQRKLWRD